MRKKLVFCLILCRLSCFLFAQNTYSTPQELDQYIQQALDSNITLRQKQVSLSKSLMALEEAKSYFVPHVQLLGNYTLARGGRQIIVPVGDLLNPVYNTLNQLTGSMAFPQINNAREQFFPNNFYDVRVRTSYGLISPERRYNQSIKQQEVTLSELEIAIYKKELTKEVKTAYYTYLMALEAVRIYEETKLVVGRALATNQSLYANGKGLPANVHRSQAEVQQVEAQWLSAQNDAATAKAYFNFLLNRRLEDSISVKIMPATRETLGQLPAYSTAQGREEIAQLDAKEQIDKNVLALQESYRKPRLSSFIDLGAQAFDFSIDKDAPYFLGGLQLEVPIFQGKKNLRKIDQAQLSLQQTQLEKEQAGRQIELALYNAYTNLRTAASNYQAALQQELAAKSYFQQVDKGRSEGIYTFIEWLDARNQLTQSAIQVQINKYKYLICQAAYERESTK